MSQKYKVYINNRLKIIEDDWDSFCSEFSVIIAAGGLVVNNNNELLMIYRNDKWDLPKGKLENKELIKDCAIREVKEETGVSNLEIIRELYPTYHTYLDNGNKVLKKTYWYTMKTNSLDSLTPQNIEGITKACWIPKEEILLKIENTYGNIKEIIKSNYLI